MKAIWIDDSVFRWCLVKRCTDIDFTCIENLGDETTDQINQAITSHPWDIIILDHDMPGLDGMNIINIHKDYIKSIGAVVIICSWNGPAASRMFYACQDHDIPAFKMQYKGGIDYLNDIATIVKAYKGVK